MTRIVYSSHLICLTSSHLCTGTLFRLDTDLSVHRIIENVTIPNGMSWTRDDKSFFFTDSPSASIVKYKYDRRGIDLASKTTFFKTDEGVPDGHCQDAEGHLWIALFGAGKVVRVSPEGEIVAEIHLPARCVTCPGICGEDLYVTSAEEEEPEKHPESTKLQGAVFRIPIGIRGGELSDFRGDAATLCNV